MNVYSLHLIPSLKIKFCEFFGIASTVALSQLRDRVYRLEHQMSRYDKVRRAKRRVVTKRFPTPTRRVLKKSRKATLSTAKEISSPAQTLQAMEVSKLEGTVVFLRLDEETRKIVKSYFGEGIKFLEIDEIEAMDKVPHEPITALFFDRALLGDEKIRELLKNKALANPMTRMVGISSYLTLALAQTQTPGLDFASHLTRPLSIESLATVFEGKRQEAI